MFEKLKDGANKLKAKIGGDELDEKLVEAVSEQNWQASTQQLHEIANAAYNYQKWQRINEFIWQKLKKSKSWKKILKTFNLIDFLLKNGPPSIISNFKYDLYQLRTFESYSNYVEGLDKGEPIREKAKGVIALLQNEELLEEERVKAKNIREKMSSVVGGSSYGGHGNSGSSGSGNSGYGAGGYGGSYGGSGSYGSSKQESESRKKNENNAYNYGNSVGAYGDYTYDKSTLDKYKDTKYDKTSTTEKKEERKPDIVVETKKPFEKIASKLSKPGERREEKVQEVRQVASTNIVNKPAANNNPTNKSGGDIIDIFELGPSTTQPTNQPLPFNKPPKPQVQVQQPIQQPTQQPPQTTVQPNIYQQAPQNTPQQVQQTFNQPQQLPYGQQQFQGQQFQGQQFQANQAPMGYNQYTQQPSQYGQYGQFPNQFGQPINQYGQQPQLNQFGQPNQFAYAQQPPQQQAYSPYINPMYPTTAPLAANSYQPSGNLNAGITLNTTTKKEEDFGGYSTSQTTSQNVNWLSSTEKGLIDFSDFGAEIKKDPKKQQGNQQINNNIQIDAWSW